MFKTSALALLLLAVPPVAWGQEQTTGAAINKRAPEKISKWNCRVTQVYSVQQQFAPTDELHREVVRASQMCDKDGTKNYDSFVADNRFGLTTLQWHALAPGQPFICELGGTAGRELYCAPAPLKTAGPAD